MIGFKVIRSGQRAAVWDETGKLELVDGPKRLFLVAQTIEYLERYSAGPNEYLAVCFRDGRREHVPGPTALWFDPVEHDHIEVCAALSISAHEAVVVYRQQGDGVQRRVVRGPAVFMPTAQEWLHNFQWHGADPHDPRRKIPRALKFEKLRVIPDQMYFDVEDVRTADDALVVVKLMIFFELVDIERMLDQTHDPVADFINAVSADAIDFAATLSFEQFKEQTERLNELDTYPQLVGRSERIGYRINKVVYRGYHASGNLQAMHDGAIEARTRLKLEAETERQAQELADMKLQRERQRARDRQALEAEEVEHKNQLARMELEEKLHRRQAMLDQRHAARRRDGELEVEHLQSANREQLSLLGGMQGMRVDLTQYLVAHEQHPDKLIQVAHGAGPQFHLHEEEG